MKNTNAAAPEMLELLEDIDGAFWEGDLKASGNALRLKNRVQKIVLKMIKAKAENKGRNKDGNSSAI